MSTQFAVVDIREQPLTEDRKKQICDGFSRHALAVTGFAEGFEPVAFVAMSEEAVVGAVVVAQFWGLCT